MSEGGTVSNDIAELRVIMERVAGDVRLITERQEQAKLDIRRIEESNKEVQTSTNLRIQGHADRIQVLEAARQRGLGALWMGGAIGSAAVAILGLILKVVGAI